MLPTEEISFGSRKQTQNEADGDMVDAEGSLVDEYSIDDILDGWKLLV
jgi:hypothetical protein